MDPADFPPVFERSAAVSQEECNCRQRAAETPDTILIVDDSDLNRAILENIFPTTIPSHRRKTARRAWKNCRPWGTMCVPCCWML